MGKVRVIEGRTEPLTGAERAYRERTRLFWWDTGPLRFAWTSGVDFTDWSPPSDVVSCELDDLIGMDDFLRGEPVDG